jgi:hypothetical protein
MQLEFDFTAKHIPLIDDESDVCWCIKCRPKPPSKPPLERPKKPPRAMKED